MTSFLSKTSGFFAGLASPYVTPDDIVEGFDPHLVAYHDKNCFISEQYKLLCRKMFFLAREQEKEFKTIMFTSCQPREGKTTSICNFALTLAVSYGKRTLLIDSDLRRSNVHKLFGIPKKPGLVEVLREEVDFEEAVCNSLVPRLSVLPAGSSNIDAGDFLQSRSYLALVQRLRNQFDHILFDTPPVLKVSDATIVAQFSDAIFFIVKSAVTPRATVIEGLETLENTGNPVTATLLVATPASPDYYSYLTKSTYRDYYRNRYVDYSAERDKEVGE